MTTNEQTTKLEQAVLQPTFEAQQGAKVIHWAESVHTTEPKRGTTVPNTVGKNSNGELIIVEKPNRSFSSISCLDERVAWDEATIDDHIQLTKEQLKAFEGQLTHAKYYANPQNIQDELDRTGREIERLLCYRRRLRFIGDYHEHMTEVLKEQVEQKGSELKSLIKLKLERQTEREKKAQEDALKHQEQLAKARAARSGQPYVPTTPTDTKKKKKSIPDFIERAIDIIMKQTGKTREHVLAENFPMYL